MQIDKLNSVSCIASRPVCDIRRLTCHKPLSCWRSLEFQCVVSVYFKWVIQSRLPACSARMDSKVPRKENDKNGFHTIDFLFWFRFLWLEQSLAFVQIKNWKVASPWLVMFVFFWVVSEITASFCLLSFLLLHGNQFSFIKLPLCIFLYFLSHLRYPRSAKMPPSFSVALKILISDALCCFYIFSTLLMQGCMKLPLPPK